MGCKNSSLSRVRNGQETGLSNGKSCLSCREFSAFSVADDERRLMHEEEVKKGKKALQVDLFHILGIPKVTDGTLGELVAAGWPSWLAEVAPEAIINWLPQSERNFYLLHRIGQGTYSVVYKARDTRDEKFVALKRVEFDHLDPESVAFMAREILILRRLDHPNILKLEGLIVLPKTGSLYLIFEYMEHDLSGLALLSSYQFKESQVKYYMKQLLSGLDHCHSRNVLHRDIKCENLLIDANGTLKIGDFGLACFLDPEQGVPLTGLLPTIWYRAPELMLKASHYGVAVDLWSAGCVLGELYDGNPIFIGTTEIEQLHSIFKLCCSPSEEFWTKLNFPTSATRFKPLTPRGGRIQEIFKNMPSAAIGLLQTLLSIDPDRRGTAAAALESEYFMTDPLPCNNSRLPPEPDPCESVPTKSQGTEARRPGVGQKTSLESRSKSSRFETDIKKQGAEQVGQDNLEHHSGPFLRWMDDLSVDFARTHSSTTSCSSPTPVLKSSAGVQERRNHMQRVADSSGSGGRETRTEGVTILYGPMSQSGKTYYSAPLRTPSKTYIKDI